MKKILLVGKFNTVFQDMSNFLMEYFQVQACIDKADMVKGMLKLNHPDVVVISLIGLNKDNEKMFMELKLNYARTPVVCIGSEGEIETMKVYMKEPQFSTITRQKNKETIMEEICRRINMTYGEEGVVENNVKKSILLVDDSVIQLRALNEMLKDEYDVQMATSGMQALTLIGKKLPDIIFLDYEMPMCDGKMTLEMIRQVDEAKDVPVVFLTGVNDKDHIEAVIKLRPAGYILKPASKEKIYETISEILV
ncbi:MAG: response regulator [Lachnospiraceae bacterium]|nr:response regulator [Lachnospiraceae bacterium]